jgi:hypothetical protein
MVQDRPQKSIQLSALYRTHTGGDSLKYCGIAYSSFSTVYFIAYYINASK